jgi:hypothetical protein
MKLARYHVDPAHALKKLPPIDDRHRYLYEKPVSYDELVGWEIQDWAAKLIESDRNVDVPGMPGVKMHSGITKGDMQYFMHVDFYRRHGGQPYCFDGAFLKELLQSEIEGAPASLVPDEFSAYVAFPRGMIPYKDLTILGAYISVGKPPEVPQSTTGDKHVWCTFLSDIDLDRNAYGLVSNYFPIYKEFITFDIGRVIQEGEYVAPTDAMRFFTKLAFLCLIYINSGNPDIRHLKPEGHLSKSMRQGMINRGQGDKLEDEYSPDIATPVNLVGGSWKELEEAQYVSWGWKKPDNYQLEKWKRRGYFRAVAHGPGRALRKAMWFPPQMCYRNKDLL